MEKKKKRSLHRLTIYGQVVITITVLSLFFFLSFGIIFRSVNERHLREVREQRGFNYSSIVEGALYHSMLANDRSALENTLDVINSLPGIEDINMYDSLDNLVYSSFTGEMSGHGNPECTDCHTNLGQMFSRAEKTVRIINLNSGCEMSNKDHDYRLLMIKSPILNQPSCYTASCHAHEENDQVLGSFFIRIPLEDLDQAVKKSSINFYLFGGATTLLLAAFLLFNTRRNINRPLNEIILASEEVSRGDRSTRLDVESSRLSDIQLVSTAFNKMLDNLQSTTEELQEWSNKLEKKVKDKTAEISEMQNELIHVERVASLGKLSSSVAHE
ncbi:HAMP domain-containing protein, partial [Bacteroidota bacterium]